jgi:hypothetical protein
MRERERKVTNKRDRTSKDKARDELRNGGGVKP